MDTEFSVSVRFYRLSEALQPYFTALYATTVECGPDMTVVDCLHPEWAALRFTEGPPPVACIGSGPLVAQWPFVANGPTSKAINFGVTRSRIWGLGLQPAGWAKFVPHAANSLSDRTVDGSTHEAFAHFAPILPIVPWDSVGDGTVFAPFAQAGHPPVIRPLVPTNKGSVGSIPGISSSHPPGDLGEDGQ